METSNLTPEQRAMYEITIAGNMSEKHAREAEIKEAVEKAERQAKERAIVKLIDRGTLSDQEIAEDLEVPLSQIAAVRAETGKRSAG